MSQLSKTDQTSQQENEEKRIKQLLKLVPVLWMKSASFLSLSASGVKSFLNNSHIRCNDELQIFQGLVAWWKHKPVDRQTDLKQVLQAIHAEDLPKSRVNDIVAYYELDKNHPLVMFYNSLPIETIATLRPLRERANNVHGFMLKLREFTDVNRIWRLLVDVRGNDLYRYQKLQSIVGSEVVEAAGMTFVQKPTLEFEQINSTNMRSLHGHCLFDLNSTKNQKVLLVLNFEERDQERDIIFTVFHAGRDSYEKKREGKLTMTKSMTHPDAKPLLFVRKEQLIIVQPLLYVYDVTTMTLKGKLVLNTRDACFLAGANYMNKIVMLGALSVYVFDINDFNDALEPDSDKSIHVQPRLSFQSPIKYDVDSHVAVDILGVRLFLLVVSRGYVTRITTYCCDLASVLRGECVTHWAKQVVALPMLHLDYRNLKSIEVKRQQSRREGPDWKYFLKY